MKAISRDEAMEEKWSFFQTGYEPQDVVTRAHVCRFVHNCACYQPRPRRRPRPWMPARVAVEVASLATPRFRGGFTRCFGPIYLSES